MPESKCSVCHPEILTKGTASDWCKEHGVPESACVACHPELAVMSPAPDSQIEATVLPPVGSTATAPGTTTASGPAPVAASHLKPDLSLAQPLVSKPGKDPKMCQTHARRVQFASPESVRKAGINLAPVVERPMAATLSVNAETDYDRTRYAQVVSPVAGRVYQVLTRAGAAVRKGDVLALIESAEVGKAKADLLESLAILDARGKTLARIQASVEKGLRTEVELQEAQAAVKESRIKLFNAQQALANLGMPVSEEALKSAGQQPSVRIVHLCPQPHSSRLVIHRGADPIHLACCRLIASIIWPEGDLLAQVNPS